MMEMLRQQREMMAMNQQLVATMLRRMDLEEERRNKAEEKVLEAAEAAKKAAVAAADSRPFQPSTAPSSSTATAPAVVPPTSGFGGSNRAEKHLPNLPLIDHQGMGKGCMKEVETWHSFLETLSSWLALQEEAFVRELQLCIPVKTEILQAPEPRDGCSELEVVLLQDSVPCQVGARNRALEVLLEAASSECLWVRGDSDDHLSVQHCLPDGSCLCARTGSEVVSACGTHQKAHRFDPPSRGFFFKV